jgi:acyl-CoA reductase-like NAD-dependent aldehyde dehydrogenase
VQRRTILERAAELMRERSEAIAAVVSAETGGTFGWGMFNVDLAAGMLAAAGACADLDDEETLASVIPGKTIRAIRQPAGVVVGMAPWNAPVILGTRAIAAPLALGNTVVLKGSEECPRTHGAIAECLQDAGAPDGVVNYITHAPADAAEVVEALIAHPAVRRVNFTGSSRVGAMIAETAGRHLTRTLLELGGKAPLLVLDGADLDQAAAAANFGAFMHQGQICMSTDRIIVQADIASAFTERLAERARNLSTGDPSDPATAIGPVINPAALERLQDLIQDAVAHGAQVVCGGEARGSALAPTVLKDVTPAMRIYSEEIFGPVVSIIEASDVDEAVRIANDVDYGLSSAVFAADEATGRAVALRLETGMCHINDATVHDEPQMPFGGVKASGWGRFGGRAAVDEFTELRAISVQETPRDYPI